MQGVFAIVFMYLLETNVLTRILDEERSSTVATFSQSTFEVSAKEKIINLSSHNLQ